jgi:CRP-like cAMP-binding protein
MDEARLASVPLFASLSRRDRRRVAQLADEIDLPAGRRLVDQGEWAYEVFVLLDGTAEVTRDGAHVADLGPGDFLGEMGTLGKTQRNASVVATSPVRAIVMTAHDVRTLARDLPAIGRPLEQAISERAATLTSG